MTARSRTVLARLPGRLTDAQLGLVEAWAPTGGSAEPVRAASVVLLRETSAGLETYLLHRHSEMPFAAGMAVFPGGRVDPADGNGEDAWVRCALRETREETSVVLGRDGLLAWAHWITPEFEPRRYDTRFYCAELPPSAVPRDQSGETDRAGWVRPVDALADADAGRIGLMPPTRSILLELADFSGLAELRDAAEGRVVEVVLPRPVRTADGWRFAYPGAHREGR